MKILQWSTFAGACILSSAALGYNFQGKNDAQLAALAGAWGLSIVSAYAEHRSLEPEQMLQMVKNARLDLFEQLLDRHCHQVYDAALTPALPEKPQLSFFDWKKIKNDPDKWPHLAICGGTGDGKTTLTQSLIQFLGEKAIALDPHYKPGNYPGLPVVAKGRNYGNYPGNNIGFENLIAGTDCSYSDAIATIQSEMDKRYKLLEKSQDNFTPYLFILDEFNTFISQNKQISQDILSLVREARKVKLRLILLVQSDLLKDFNWSGQGAARKSLRWIRLGEFALAHAAKLNHKQLSQWVATQSHPILVEQFPSSLPVPLNQLISTNPTNQSVDNSFSALPSPTQSQQYLDKLYHLQPDDHSSHPENIYGSPESLKANDANTFQSNKNISAFQEPGSEIAESIPESLKTSILKMHLGGMSKGEIIMELWQAKPGGSKAYQEANQIFEAIKAYWKKLELWEIK